LLIIWCLERALLWFSVLNVGIELKGNWINMINYFI
jgi:hypothetical protein